MSFNFGLPEDVAQLYIESVKDLEGPPQPEVHYEELPEPQVRDAMTHLWVALSRALDDGAGDEVIEVLQSQYEEIVLYLAEISEDFAQKVISYKIVFPGGAPNNRYYRDLVLDQRSAN